MQEIIGEEQAAILEKEQERTRRIRELVGHLVTLTNKLRRANGLNKRTLAEEIRVVGSALRKLGRSQTRKGGTPARSTLRYTLTRK
jgi:flagellar biosynthesis/type III secretory pathway chaperone